MKMKTNRNKILLKKDVYGRTMRLFVIILFSILSLHSTRAQFVNTINIGSVQQTVNPATTYNAWQVILMTPDMQNAPSYVNTTAPTGPPAGGIPQPPVAIGQNALVLAQPFASWAAGTYLSCFAQNTIYTPTPAQNNFTNCAMTIRRRFNICSDSNQQVTFNFNVRCDDYINSIIVDAGTANSITLFNVPAPAMAVPVTINSVRFLAPGIHTLDIVSANWEDRGGSYFTVNGAQMQWNPFGVAIAGNITTTGNVLLNAPAPTINPITGISSICAGTTTTLSNTTPGGIWSSSNTGVATITQAGIVTGISPGNAVINYNIQQGTCAANATFNLTVTDCHCEDSCNWSLTGNSFVKPYNFIGSLNNADFKIRTNNIQRMVVTAAGNVGINTPAPAKTLDVNGEVRIGILPVANPNERLLFANALGDVHALLTTGNTNHYLSGNGTWQNLPTGGGITNADQGLTLNGNTVLLGDGCSRGGGRFAENREINMNDFDLYFNSGKLGKLYMGRTDNSTVECRPLFTRLEISSEGLEARNGYATPNPSTSGLRFTNLTASDEPIANETGGVLSLDKEGDVIWVKACCNSGLAAPQLDAILDRLTKLESEVKESKAQAAQLRAQLTQMDVVLSKTNTIVLNQNVPNPFAESTIITYSIPRSFNSAQLVFSTIKGEVIKTVDIKTPGKGQVNVFASDISSGLYMYTLVVDGRQVDSRKMIKQ
jgi:hypothetical protein